MAPPHRAKANSSAVAALCPERRPLFCRTAPRAIGFREHDKAAIIARHAPDLNTLSQLSCCLAGLGVRREARWACPAPHVPHGGGPLARQPPCGLRAVVGRHTCYPAPHGRAISIRDDRNFTCGRNRLCGRLVEVGGTDVTCFAVRRRCYFSQQLPARLCSPVVVSLGAMSRKPATLT